MANNKNMVSGYFILDKVTITEEYKEQLNAIKKSFLIEWSLLTESNGRELYLGVLRDASKIEDQVIIDEDGNEQVSYGLLTVIKDRNPEVLGVWNKDGSELGTEIKITPAEYDENGNIIRKEVIETLGTPTYPFNKTKYQSMIPPRIQADEEGNEISREEFYDICSFGGFKQKINFS